MAKLSLREQQSLFAVAVGDLIRYVYGMGWELSLDEAYRPPETARLYERQGRGSARSLHCQKLAIDLNLFIDGKYQRRGAAYEPLGEFWKTLHPLARWGGDWQSKDYRHFSFTRGGRE